VPPRLPWTLTLHSRPPEPIDDALVALTKSAPESSADLRAMQLHYRQLARKVIPCTVGLLVGQAQGSGVIISPDGYVLTAGHVSSQADRNVMVILQDGRTVRGKTLGANHGIDSGLIKISDKNPDGGDWPFADVARSKPIKPGEWCMATGHPGGYQRGRTPVVRIGRILTNSSGAISTDCTLVGGDSGGPLFDMEGRVIGIHSRIGGPLSANFHVPADTYRETWDRLATNQVWGGRLKLPRAGGPYVGVNGEGENECRITRVTENSPAAAAGIKIGDVVKTFGGKPIRSYEELGEFVARQKPGDKVKLEIMRGQQSLTLELTVGRRPN
jgi:serine protease Do